MLYKGKTLNKLHDSEHSRRGQTQTDRQEGDLIRLLFPLVRR
jgi:hypothetical protein